MSEERKFQIGLFRANSLHDNRNGILCYTINIRDDVIMFECNKNDNSTRMLKRTFFRMDFKEIDESKIEKGTIKILSEDGSRWEGDWYNNKPFGFGSVYDGEDNRIYSGFMFEGKKIGYGTEYFADNHKVDYCGNFINDKRHGWGTTYDRNGNKLYEGEWGYGINQFSSCIIYGNKKYYELINFDVIELIIEDNCFSCFEGDLVIENIELLQYISIGENSVSNATSFTVRNCKNLCIIDIEDGAFSFAKMMIVESISGMII